jgi:hypothetical protein
MLFILTMEVLNALFRKADVWSLFKPLGARGICHRASLYADDLVVFVAPETRDLHLLHGILFVFEEAFGLACNIGKCQMTPIGCSEDQLSVASSLFQCTVVHFPTTYLGIPLSMSKLPKSALQHLIDKATDRLPAWKGKLVHQSGRLTLVRTTLSALPIYIAISIELPPWLFKALRKIMTTFLWSGTEVVQSGKCLAAWERVQRPLPLGGLGILNLRLMGMALRLRWLWLQRTEPS